MNAVLCENYISNDLLDEKVKQALKTNDFVLYNANGSSTFDMGAEIFCKYKYDGDSDIMFEFFKLGFTDNQEKDYLRFASGYCNGYFLKDVKELLSSRGIKFVEII